MNTHPSTECNLEATTLSLYRYYEGLWTKHRAINYGRLKFEITGITSEEPRRNTHKDRGVQQRRQIYLTEVHAVEGGAPEGGNCPAESIHSIHIRDRGMLSRVTKTSLTISGKHSRA
jgi:hypothetical protein